jgi:hypothetical protein
MPAAASARRHRIGASADRAAGTGMHRILVRILRMRWCVGALAFAARQKKGLSGKDRPQGKVEEG